MAGVGFSNSQVRYSSANCEGWYSSHFNLYKVYSGVMYGQVYSSLASEWVHSPLAEDLLAAPASQAFVERIFLFVGG